MLRKATVPVRVRSTAQAWSSLCPEKRFFGLTLDRYKEVTRAVFDLREEALDLKRRMRAVAAQIRDADIAALDMTQSVIHSVRADPTEGENSPFYAALGYVRRKDRRVGRRRGRAAALTDTEPAVADAVREAMQGA